MHPRGPLFIGLAAVHLALALISPSALAPALAGSIYLPLLLLKKFGLPVFGAAPSGGWAAPSAFGWTLVVLIWLAVWWLVATVSTHLVNAVRRQA